MKSKLGRVECGARLCLKFDFLQVEKKLCEF